MGVEPKEIALLARSVLNVKYSFKKMMLINLEKPLTEIQLEILDSYSSRFLRFYEVLINQVLRTLLQILGEYKKTVIDNFNKAEALELISSSESFNFIRQLRNMIAHEYAESEWIEIYQSLMKYTPVLFDASDKILLEIKKRELNAT